MSKIEFVPHAERCGVKSKIDGYRVRCDLRRGHRGNHRETTDLDAGILLASWPRDAAGETKGGGG